MSHLALVTGASSGIRVTVIHPGPVKTAFFNELAFRLAEGEASALHTGDVADFVVQILSSRRGATFHEVCLSPSVGQLQFGATTQ